MIELVAILLLIVRIVALHRIFRVIKTQRYLMQRPVKVEYKGLMIDDPEIAGYRKRLFLLTLGLAGSHLIPIIFDMFILLRETEVAFTEVSSQPLIVMYAISNAFASLLAAVLVSRIYKNAVEVDETHEQSDHTLMND